MARPGIGLDLGLDQVMVKRVLMIAFHFPPLRGSSGVQRTLKFAQYLPQYGWEPVVLSAHHRAYSDSGDDQLRDIPPQTVVHRAFALDASRHLSIKGRYPGILALPDRWVSWLAGALPSGLRLIRKYRPAVIWSTYPIATAHLIGLTLHRLTGIPWVADMRDPMSDNYYPLDPFLHRVYRWIETRVISSCSMVVCTTAGAVTAYRLRFPELPPSHFCLIENGYDEDNFSEAEDLASTKPMRGEQFTLVHSGIIYPLERDPIPLFEAIATMLQQGLISNDNFKLVLRGTGHDDYLAGLIRQYGVMAVVDLRPQLDYREALAEMLRADGLLILQASNCNHQVPAKLYEYLRARRPILALTDPDGETATTLRKAGIDTIASLQSKNEIMQALTRFMDLVGSNTAPIASAPTIMANSRRSRTAELSSLLDRVRSGVKSC
jgi:glycosyltransferase involved in cell wall biosynthesis